MKKLFFLLVCLCLFASCSKDIAEGDSNPLPTMLSENGANSALILPEASQVNVQNTKRGCEIIMMTELGRQVFVLPYHYDLSAYEGLKVSTTEGRKKIEPGAGFCHGVSFGWERRSHLRRSFHFSSGKTRRLFRQSFGRCRPMGILFAKAVWKYIPANKRYLAGNFVSAIRT